MPAETSLGLGPDHLRPRSLRRVQCRPWSARSAHFIPGANRRSLADHRGQERPRLFSRRGIPMDVHFVQPSREVRLEEIGGISKQMMTDYGNGRDDHSPRLLAVRQHLKSGPTIIQLLPVESRSRGPRKERAKRLSVGRKRRRCSTRCCRSTSRSWSIAPWSNRSSANRRPV